MRALRIAAIAVLALGISAAFAGIRDEPIPIDFANVLVSGTSIQFTATNTSSSPVTATIVAQNGTTVIGTLAISLAGGASSTQSMAIWEDVEPIGFGLFATP